MEVKFFLFNRGLFMACKSIFASTIQEMIFVIFILGTVCSYLSHANAEPLLDHGQKTYSLVDCLGMPLDHKLLEKINLRNGVFIEVGANDGVTQSNTKLLEEYYGWTGILVEPSPCVFSKLCDNRPTAHCFQCALGAFEQENTYVYGDFDGDLMSSIDGKRRQNAAEHKVLMRSLQSILDEVGYSHINLFSLDTEGHELAILNGIDFSKTIFDYLLIEIYNRDYEEIINFLSSKGYDMVERFSNYNLVNNPNWDGTHNDYLFQRKSVVGSVEFMQ